MQLWEIPYRNSLRRWLLALNCHRLSSALVIINSARQMIIQKSRSSSIPLSYNRFPIPQYPFWTPLSRGQGL